MEKITNEIIKSVIMHSQHKTDAETNKIYHTLMFKINV